MEKIVWGGLPKKSKDIHFEEAEENAGLKTDVQKIK